MYLPWPFRGCSEHFAGIAIPVEKIPNIDAGVLGCGAEVLLAAVEVLGSGDRVFSLGAELLTSGTVKIASPGVRRSPSAPSPVHRHPVPLRPRLTQASSEEQHRAKSLSRLGEIAH